MAQSYPVSEGIGRIHYLESVTERTYRQNNCISCVVENYFNLQENTHYFMKEVFPSQEYTLKLYKTEDYLRLQFEADIKILDYAQPCEIIGDEMVFFMIFEEGGRPEWFGPMTKEHKGYSIEIPTERVEHENNDQLHANNSLMLEFNYRHLCGLSSEPIAHYGKSTDEDREALSRDMLALYEEDSKNVDFIIISSESDVFRVHKEICISRSPYFRYLPNNRLKLNCSSRAIDRGIRYIYSGKIKDWPLKVPDLLELFYFAHTCELPDLLNSTCVALRDSMNIKNFQEIRQDAINSGIYQLTVYTQNFENEVQHRRDCISGRKGKKPEEA